MNRQVIDQDKESIGYFWFAVISDDLEILQIYFIARFPSWEFPGILNTPESDVGANWDPMLFIVLHDPLDNICTSPGMTWEKSVTSANSGPIPTTVTM